MVNRGVAVCGAFALLVGCAGYLKPPPPGGGDTLDVEAARFKTANGFRVFVLPDPDSRVVRLEVRYEVGSAQDPPGKAGLAHLVEHLMFQTKVVTPSGPVPFSRELARIAHSWNAYTSPDSTHYYVQSLPDSLSNVFAAEMNRLASGCTTWDAKTFERERDVVRNEIRQRHRSPDSNISGVLYEAIYPAGHPYRHEVGGTEASISDIQLADVCAFVQRYYVPTRAMILVVGNTTEREVRRIVESLAVVVPSSPRGPRENFEPIPAGRRRLVEHELDVDRAQLLVAFPLPPRGTRDYRLARLARSALAADVRMFASMFDWGDGAVVFDVGGAHAPAMVIWMTLRDASRRDEALDFTWKSLRTSGRMFKRAAPLDKNERWRGAKAALIARYDEPEARASMYADDEQFDDKGLFVAGHLRELDDTTPDDVRAVMKRVFAADNATVVFIRPRRGAGMYRGGPTAPLAPLHDPDRWKPEIDLAEAERPLEVPVRRRAAGVQEFTLDNGLRVRMLPREHDAPQVVGCLVVRAGSIDEPGDRPGLAQAAGGDAATTMTRFCRSGLSSMAAEIVESLSYAVRWHAVRNRDRWRESMRRSLRLDRTARNLAYERDLRTALYGAQHPYTRGTITLSGLDRITGGAVADFQRKFHTAGNATLILVGRFDPELMRKHIVYQFNHLGGTRQQRPRVPEPAPTGKRFVAGEGDASRPVTRVDLTWVAGRGIDKSHAARLVLERVLEEKLAALREEHSLTYGVRVAYVPRPDGPGEWRIQSEVDSDRVGEAILKVRAILEDMQSSPQSYRAEFIVARRKLVEESLVQEDTTSALAGRLSFIEGFGLSQGFYDELIAELARSTPASVHAVLKAELRVTAAVYGVLGPAEAVAAARKALSEPRR